MTKRETGALAFKVFSLYVIYNAIVQFAYWVWPLIWRFRESPGLTDQWIFASAGVAAVIHLGLGVLIWWRADAWAGRIVSGKETASSTAVLAAADIQAIAFSVVGLWAALHAIPGLVEIAFPYVAPRTIGEALQVRPVRFDRLAGLIVQLIIGLGLLFYAQGLIGPINRVAQRVKGRGRKER